MPEKPPPLPVAADRLAISNRLSKLFADRSSLIKKLVAQSSTAQNPSRHTLRVVDDDNDMLFGAPVNQGVGYVSDKAPRDTKREDKMLRGRMLGKRKTGASEPRSKLEESESDDEQGRGSLGKRKRPRRAREVVKADEQLAEAGDTSNVQGMNAQADTDSTTQTRENAPHTQGDRPKKKKKRNKGKATSGHA